MFGDHHPRHGLDLHRTPLALLAPRAFGFGLAGHGEERPHLFSGDSLFPGGVGNTFGDGDAFVQLLNGMEERVFGRLPDETWVYPGHGDDTTLGDERPHLPEWRERGW